MATISSAELTAWLALAKMDAEDEAQRREDAELDRVADQGMHHWRSR